MFFLQDELFQHFVENDGFKKGIKCELPRRPHDLLAYLFWFVVVYLPSVYYFGSYLLSCSLAVHLGLSLIATIGTLDRVAVLHVEIKWIFFVFSNRNVSSTLEKQNVTMTVQKTLHATPRIPRNKYTQFKTIFRTRVGPKNYFCFPITRPYFNRPPPPTLNLLWLFKKKSKHFETIYKRVFLGNFAVSLGVKLQKRSSPSLFLNPPPKKKKIALNKLPIPTLYGKAVWSETGIFRLSYSTDWYSWTFESVIAREIFRLKLIKKWSYHPGPNHLWLYDKVPNVFF